MVLSKFKIKFLILLFLLFFSILNFGAFIRTGVSFNIINTDISDPWGKVNLKSYIFNFVLVEKEIGYMYSWDLKTYDDLNFMDFTAYSYGISLPFIIPNTSLEVLYNFSKGLIYGNAFLNLNFNNINFSIGTTIFSIN